MNKMIKSNISYDKNTFFKNEYKGKCKMEVLNEEKIKQKLNDKNKIKKYGKFYYVMLNKDGIFFCKSCQYKDIIQSIYINDLINAKKINSNNIIILLNNNHYNNYRFLYFQDIIETDNFIKCYEYNELMRSEELEIKNFYCKDSNNELKNLVIKVCHFNYNDDYFIRKSNKNYLDDKKLSLFSLNSICDTLIYN